MNALVFVVLKNWFLKNTFYCDVFDLNRCLAKTITENTS
jgi:hypothetical protein